jgi:hypothetical protein
MRPGGTPPPRAREADEADEADQVRSSRPIDGGQLPTASVTHFLVKLVLAAPASFLSAASLSQTAVASVSHFFMKLVCAAPASFFSPACALQLAA